MKLQRIRDTRKVKILLLTDERYKISSVCESWRDHCPRYLALRFLLLWDETINRINPFDLSANTINRNGSQWRKRRIRILPLWEEAGVSRNE